jgi:hypothetical protein
MRKMIRVAASTVTAVAALAFSSVASAAYVFSNDNGGNGTFSGTDAAFSIVGATDGANFDPDGNPNTSFYVQTFAQSELVTFTWSYSTADSGGGLYDPAGFIHNGVETQLSVDGDPGQGSSGTWTETVLAGDTFGWYVASVDSLGGCGELDINGGGGGPLMCVFSSGGGTNPVPEPENLALMAAGLLAIAAARRRNGR